jgi:hypothetical protein
MGPFDKLKNSFNKIGDDIKKSNAKINNDIQKSNNSIGNKFRDIPKPKIDMKALQEATGIIAGIVSITPIGKLLVTASVAIADKETHGKATAYLNNGHNVNSTLSMVPGGMLFQQIANDASNGKSGDTLGKYISDPKKMIISEIKDPPRIRGVGKIKPNQIHSVFSTFIC